MFKRKDNLNKYLDIIRSKIDDPNKGLPEDVFLFLSEISPLPNVDLFVHDNNNRVLLAWRNDPWWGTGWHIPGGIIRINESFEERIQRTAQAELGTRVFFKEDPLEIRQIINKEFKTRSHHITIVFDCQVPDDYVIDNGSLEEHETGYLAWHEHCPNNILRCHEFYSKYFK